jgi:shikimate dehydrogenase
VKPISLSLGLIGFPLDCSLSPRLHAAALKALDLPGDYRLFPVPPAQHGDKDIRDLFEQMRRGEMHGLNVTIPHKQTVIPYLDELTPTALAVGAVNTIVYKAGKLIGENTDCPGFLADLAVQLENTGLRELCDQTGKSALVLGAGGSARAVVFGLLQNGWQVSITARRPEQAQELMWSFSSCPMLVGEMNMLRSEAAQNFQLIVNTTPLGMHPNVEDSPWPANLPFPKKVFVYDLVYNPPESTLLRSARNSGLPAANGLGMLVRQAVLAFRAWTGLEPPWEEMYQTVAAQA